MKRPLLYILCLIVLPFQLLLAQPITTPYAFPLKPGMESWTRLKSVDEMYRACQVPGQILSEITTAALANTCLNYPAMSVLMVHSSPQQGFDAWEANFNGISALLKRPDALQELLKIYQQYDVKGYKKYSEPVDQGKYTFRLMAIEAILAQPELQDKVSAEQKRALLEKTLEHYNEMRDDTLYGFASLQSVGRVIAVTADKLGITDPSLKSDVLDRFKQTGLLSDKAALPALIERIRQHK